MLTILENKPIIGTTEEEKRIDLLTKSRDDRYTPPDDLAVIVKKGEEMRPDILSSNFYGSPDYYDVVLKYNGCSNPFSIDEGDVFFSSQLDIMISNLTPSQNENVSVDIIREQYINPEKKSLLDTKISIIEAKRLEAIKRKAAASNSPGSILPPNVSENGDKEITISQGKIFFGQSIENLNINDQNRNELVSKLKKGRQ